MYLDPGFGSMIIQFIIAGIAACGMYAVIFRKKIMDFFSRKRGVTPEAGAEDKTEE